MPYHVVPSSPRIVTRWAARVACVAAPLAVLVLVTWAAWGHEVLWHRRVLVLMAYLLLLSVALGAAIVAVMGTCFTAVHKAFSAGYQTGLQVGAATEAGRPHGPDGDPGHGKHLRLVDQ